MTARGFRHGWKHGVAYLGHTGAAVLLIGVIASSNYGRKVQVTLGDLIAAAFDTVGGEVKKVARVVSSPAMTACCFHSYSEPRTAATRSTSNSRWRCESVVANSTCPVSV